MPAADVKSTDSILSQSINDFKLGYNTPDAIEGRRINLSFGHVYDKPQAAPEAESAAKNEKRINMSFAHVYDIAPDMAQKGAAHDSATT